MIKNRKLANMKMTITRISSSQITRAVKLLCMQANCFLPRDVWQGLQVIAAKEESELARDLLSQVFINANLAAQTRRPICQDTGLAIVFVEIGQQVVVVGEDLETAINKGVKQAYGEDFLRKSVVSDPVFDRKNTTTNTPTVIHTKLVPGHKIKIIVAPKGGGSENMSALKMLKPAEGVQGIIDFVVNTVKNAGPNPCPPIHVGIGIGGSMEYAALLAKKALLHKIIPEAKLVNLAKKDKKSELELKIWQEIQKLGIGAQGLGGTQTAFGVSIEMFPCHIASMPVAVNINCHAARHAEIVLDGKTEPALPIPSVFKTKNYYQGQKSAKFENISLPIQETALKKLKAGDKVLLTGELYTARDAAHKKLINCLINQEPLPINIKGQTIYYVGPCPARGNEIIGPAGPTTSGRMDIYTPQLLELGLKGMIGKGVRDESVIAAIKKQQAIYFVATGGGACLLAQHIKKAEVVAYPELGAEAIYKLTVKDFPVIVCIDSKGNNYYEIGQQKYKRGAG